jgi:alkane 1-monooxygenase
MLKYLKYFIPSFTGIIYLITISMGEHYPTWFLIGFSLILIIGDRILPRDTEIQKFSYPSILNLSIYINLPILLIMVLIVSSFLSHNVSQWYINTLNTSIYTDFIQLKNSFNTIDKFSLVIQTCLMTGSLGTVAGHELTHRIKNKFDMFIGNWLLAFSWDCAFAIEHVYDHHKNVGLPKDPATAKRGQNIYPFIINAIAKEQIGAWKIELSRLKRRGKSYFSFKNRMIIGYLRSSFITLIAFLIGGISGMFFFILLSFLGKSLLEAINYTEHYGLVRKEGQPVCMRHSWNSNHCLSSIYLCNVTRHSDHHRSTNLKFWELSPYDNSAPMLPYGYLSMLYLSLLFPFLYRKIMDPKVKDWDINYANEEERKLINII